MCPSKCFFGLAGVLLATICATANADQNRRQLELLNQQYAQCFGELGQDSELSGIANMVALDRFANLTASFEMLSNDNFPSEDEKRLILKWGTKREKCYKIRAATFSFIPPNLANLSVASDNDQQMLVLELYKGGLTYGDFAAKRQEIETRYNGQIQQALGQYNAGAEQQNYQNRQLQIQQQNQTKPYQAPIPPRPTRSVCGWQGNQWVCNTQPTGIDASIYNQIK